MAKPTEEQLRKINQFAKEPLSEDEVYVHEFRMIGTRFVQSKMIKLDKSLLDIYKNNVNSGDVVQIADHTFGGLGSLLGLGVTLPFGRYFEGKLIEEDGETHLDGAMYMRAGQKTYVEGFTTDDIDQQLNAGTLHDSSVTISWGKSECSICGNDIRDYENCPHLPGETYKVQGKKYLCYVVAKPADSKENDRSMMYENSLVCVGAYPDAGAIQNSYSAGQGGGKTDPRKEGLQKINEVADLKLVKEDAPVFCMFSANNAEFFVKPEDKQDTASLHDMYHKMYQEGIPEGWDMATLVRYHNESVKQMLETDQEHYLEDALDGSMPANLKQQSKELENTGKGDEQSMDTIEKLCSMLGCTEEELVDKVQGLQTELSTAQNSIQEKDAEIERLAPFEQKAQENESLAEIGRKYREDLIEETIRWGVRAYGDKFNEEVNRKMLQSESLTLDDIKAFKEQYEGVAREAVNSGRVTDNGGGGDEPSQEYDDSYFSTK